MLNGKLIDVPALAWRHTVVRFTAFIKGAHPDGAFTFERIFGEQPLTETRSKIQGRSEFVSDVGGTLRAVNLLPGRIDVQASANIEFEPELSEIPEVPFPVLSPELRGMIYEGAMTVVADLQEVTRLAVGETFAFPVPEVADAYRLLGALLSTVDVYPESSSDFFYRINRARLAEMGAASFRINRLAQWVCGRFDVRANAYGVLSARQGLPAVSVTTDVSTDGDFDLSGYPEIRARVTDTLFAFSAELADKGDVP
jgi:hypothetical protein